MLLRQNNLIAKSLEADMNLSKLIWVGLFMGTILWALSYG